jgi:GTP-binding protein
MSLYPHARFITSAAEPKQLAADIGREIAFAGRSNAGKSTVINSLVERTGLARVSRTPGRTQLINFFELAPERRLVDLPGYGFARVPAAVRARWTTLMEHYFDERASLVGMVLIVDSRRGLGDSDGMMLEWVLARGRRAHVLLTKADKLNRQEALRVERATRAALAPRAVTVQLFSAPAKLGIEEARAVMDAWLAG